MTQKIMNDSKLKLILVGAVTAIVLVIGALAFNLISQNEGAQASIQEQEEFLEQTEQYVNDEASYSIRYYKEWFYYEKEKDVGLYVDFQSPSDSFVEGIEIDFIENTSVEDYLSANSQTSATVTIGRFEAEKISYTEPFGSIELQTVGYIFSKDGNIYVIEYTGEIGGDYDKFLAPAERMIQSFEF